MSYSITQVKKEEGIRRWREASKILLDSTMTGVILQLFGLTQFGRPLINITVLMSVPGVDWIVGICQNLSKIPYHYLSELSSSKSPFTVYFPPRSNLVRLPNARQARLSSVPPKYVPRVQSQAPASLPQVNL